MNPGSYRDARNAQMKRKTAGISAGRFLFTATADVGEERPKL
jgi:hypothetical protein